MTDETVNSIGWGLIGVMCGFGLGLLTFINSGEARMEGQALERGYAVQYEGSFYWKSDLEKKMFLEDFDFFKRHPEMFEEKIKPLFPGVEEFN